MSCCALHECPRWHSVGQSRAGAGKRIAAEMPPLSQLTISSWQLQGMGWIITILLPALLLKTLIFSFFFPKSHVLSCWTKVWVTPAPWMSWGGQVTHCPVAACSSGTALRSQRSLGADCITATLGHYWTWAGSPQPLIVSLTFLQCWWAKGSYLFLSPCSELDPTATFAAAAGEWPGPFACLVPAVQMSVRRCRTAGLAFLKNEVQWRIRLLTSLRAANKK